MEASSYFVHEKAICESPAIGEGTRIWEFTHVFPGAVIGSDCNLSAGVLVENDVRVGNRVTVKSGVQLWDGVEIEDDVFVGPNVTFTNDVFPRSKVYPDRFLRTLVKKGASIGANATILPGITIGRSAMIGAGSVVTRDVPDFAKVFGNPARIRGYVHSGLGTETPQPVALQDVPQRGLTVPGVSLVQLTQAVDIRGSLVAGEMPKQIPFPVRRFFIVHDVPSLEARGAHAHRECHQFLLAIGGTVNVIASDGVHSDELVLDSPQIGLHLPPMVWGIQYKYSPSASLLVLASHPYDPSDYIRSFDLFLAEKSAQLATGSEESTSLEHI